VPVELVNLADRMLLRSPPPDLIIQVPCLRCPCIQVVSQIGEVNSGRSISPASTLRMG
jgi:hypothetical protein